MVQDWDLGFEVGTLGRHSVAGPRHGGDVEQNQPQLQSCVLHSAVPRVLTQLSPRHNFS